MHLWRDLGTFEEPKLDEVEELRDEVLLLAYLELLVKGIGGVQSVGHYNQRKLLKEM